LVTIKEALTISENLSDRVYIWSNISYANILLELDSIDVAESVLLQTLEAAEGHDLKESMINIYSLLSNIYDEKENYKLAYRYYTSYSYLTQTIFTIDYKNQIDAVKIASELEAAEKLDEMEKQHSYYRLLLLVLFVVAGSIIFTLVYYQLKQRNTNVNLENKLLNERLETRNRELTLTGNCRDIFRTHIEVQECTQSFFICC